MPIDREKFIDLANQRYAKAREFWRNWRVAAQDDYAFIAGSQWLAEDEAFLKSQDRPSITFNYSEKMIDAVVGAEVSNRQEVFYAPRNPTDTGVSELWNAAAKWAREGCNAEDEESDAFRDALICGVGWTWTRLSYDDDLDGRIIIERVDPLEMFADPAAMKPGLVDRRWQDRVWWVDEAEARRHWPDAFYTVDDNDASTRVIIHGQRYNHEDAMNEEERHVGQIQIRLHETFQMESVYRVAGPMGLQEMREEDFNGLPEKPATGMYAKQRKRVYYRAYFAGDTLLEVKPSPCQDGFCFQAITAKRDRNKNSWYGLTRVMKDPQRWANKWLSQILHIVNANAKGGILAEIGAFVDPTTAQEDWSSPESVTLLNEGGLQKVEQKQAAPYPAGLDKLMSFALSSLPMVTGINLEALGLANREQAGVLESQRKQAAYGILAPIFDGQRRYRKEQGRVLLYYIHTYLSDNRLVRVGDPANAQYLPLTKQPGAPSYDIVVDQSPTAPDTKQKTWETLVEIIPAMLKAGIPLPPDLLDFTPLPSSLVTKWKQFIAQTQQQNAAGGAQANAHMQQMQQQIAQLTQQNQELQLGAQQKAAELQFQQDKTAADIHLSQQKLQAQIQLERDKAQAAFDLESQRAANERHIAAERLNSDTAMAHQKVHNEHTVKLAEAIGNSPETDLPGLFSQFAQNSAAMAEHVRAGHEHMHAALAGLSEALTRPKRLVLDARGTPIGIEPVPTTQH